MKGNLYITLALVVLLLPSRRCEAQLSLVFKSVNVNNLNAETNHKYAPEKIRLGEVVLLGEDDVSVTITAELINTSDSVIYFDGGLSTKNIKKQLTLFCFEEKFGWRKMKIYDRRDPARYDGILVRKCISSQ